MPKPATAINPKVEPKAELEKRTRRVFTPEYKLSIIQQADACKHGEKPSPIKLLPNILILKDKALAFLIYVKACE